MKLTEEVTFDSLGAVRRELNEWFGADPLAPNAPKGQAKSRDLLVSLLIHYLADELEDQRVRTLIHRVLSDLQRPDQDRING